MPYSAAVIASIFVQKGIEEGKYLTQMKLQKVVFFAHGYHLAKFGEPLINEDFQAWKFGPVIPRIYAEYKLYGSDLIMDLEYISTHFMNKNADKLSADAKETIDFTWKTTKNLTAASLSGWTHITGSPWYKVYNENARETVIGNEIIKEYFTGILYDHPALE